jgi:hypothetical protein
MILHIFTWYTCTNKRGTMIVPGGTNEKAHTSFEAWVDSEDHPLAGWEYTSKEVSEGNMLLIEFLKLTVIKT